MAEFTAMDEEGLGREPVFECPHCGGDPWPVGPEGAFDGDGERCEDCGFPGHVVADEDGAVWVASDAPGDRCERDDCEECGAWRGERS